MKKLILVFSVTFLFSTILAQEPPKASDWNWVKYESNPVLVPSTSLSGNAFDAGKLYYLSVLKLEGKYHMWYRADDLMGNSRFGYAKSDDGISWTKNANPILIPGGEGACRYESYITSPQVFYKDNKFHMYYTGLDGTYRAEEGYASSDDGLSWKKYGENPVLGCGESGCWDSHGVALSSVIFDDNQYKMWYIGADGNSQQFNKIGYATSSDGMAWERESEPIMILNESMVWDTHVFKSPEGNYYMWYTEGPWGNIGLDIRYAYSLDGLDWVVEENNIAIPRGEEGHWDDKYMGTSAVLYDEEEQKFKMWYYGADADDKGSFGYAEAINPVGVNSMSEASLNPTSFALEQNYPNPFNPSTTLKYSISEQSYVSLKVFDVLGREVAVILDKEQNAGNYVVKWSAENNTSGVYFYKIQAGNFVETKKMLLLR